jgi:hypothetical protein
LPPPTRRGGSSADTSPRRPEYKGAELDPDRGPGLGCFWFQVIVLATFILLIPLGINLDWPFEVLAILLFIVLGLLLLTGQTVIFLLRLVAADRRAHGRRRPLAGSTKTVGELEDEIGASPARDDERGATAAGGTAPAAGDTAAPMPRASTSAPATRKPGARTRARDAATPTPPVGDGADEVPGSAGREGAASEGEPPEERDPGVQQ